MREEGKNFDILKEEWDGHTGADVEVSLAGLLDKHQKTLDMLTADTQAKVLLSRVTTVNPTVRLGLGVALTFHYDHVDSTGISTGLGATAEVSITQGTVKSAYTLALQPGRDYTIEPTSYLRTGQNDVVVKVTTNDAENPQTATVRWTVNVVDLRLTSDYDLTAVAVKGSTLTIPYGFTGGGAMTKTVKLWVDGVVQQERTSTASQVDGASFAVDTKTLSHGTHTFQMVVELDDAGQVVKSNSIYLGIPVIDAESGTRPAIGLRLDYSEGDIIEAGQTAWIEATQYAQFAFPYTAYNPQEYLGDHLTDVEVYMDGQLTTAARIGHTLATAQGVFQKAGTWEVQIFATDVTNAGNSVSMQLEARVAESALNVEEPTDDLALRLLAMGKTNNDMDRAEWQHGEVTTEMEGFAWQRDGWNVDGDGALVLTGSAHATVHYKPLERPATGDDEALTLEVRFKAQSVTNDDAVLVDVLDTEGHGLAITAQEVRFITSTGTVLSRQFAYGNVYEVAVVSNPTAKSTSSTYVKTHSALVEVYVNGELCGAIQRTGSESIYQTEAAEIKLDGREARLSVYSLRAYRRALTPDEVLGLYIIDMADTERMAEAVSFNDIVDENGVITVEKVPEEMPYMIITGEQDGMATPLYAAVKNDKKPKYDLKLADGQAGEILYVNRAVPEASFRLAGGCIRLQGTSSLAYPVKNYRIYMKDSNKQAGELYLGVSETGDGGERQEKAKYALRGYKPGEAASVPVDCFCLKADYAESSSSHNTGFAVLINKTLKAAGELTPAQAHVDSEQWPYDVRTTVDGFPIYLFYRRSKDEAPTFLGKFNLNNDKSTEAVFGFCDIPGYHDNEEWFPGGENPTECWEFKNNDHPMGKFQLGYTAGGSYRYDFATLVEKKDKDGKTYEAPYWLDCWEARYPDDDALNEEYEEGKKPKYLEAVVKWVAQTDTTVDGLSTADKANRRAKFRNELSRYFNVGYLCDYYAATSIVAAVDQRVKNMMLGFWKDPEADEVATMGKMRGYFIFYDNDTILGVRNDGKLRYNWDVDESTIDAETGQPAFAGADSVLWVNLRTLFGDEIRAAYRRLRQQMTNQTILDAFGKQITDKFPPRVYNIDAVGKYIMPLNVGVTDETGKVTKYAYLDSLQGSRRYHREWWLQNRLDLLDAQYVSGNYASTLIQFKGTGEDGDHYITLKSKRDWYYALGGDVITGGIYAATTEKVGAGEQWQTTYKGSIAIGSTFGLFGVKFAQSIDFSRWAPFFADFTLPELPYLEELTMGDFDTGIEQYTTPQLTIGENLPLLRSLKVINHVGTGSTPFNTLDLTGCEHLELLDARGCTHLAVVEMSASDSLKTLRLGPAMQTLSLVGKTRLEELTWEGSEALTTLEVEGCNDYALERAFDLLREKLSE